MKTGIGKYFTNADAGTLKETADILRNPKHPLFREKLVALLSRCDEPHEFFRIVPRELFVGEWPEIKRIWKKIGGGLDYLNWWDTIYENTVYRSGDSWETTAAELSSAYLKYIGEQIRRARRAKRWTQSELARRIGIGQRNVSAIENGKSNMTLFTLLKLSKALGLEKIDLDFEPEVNPLP